MRLNIALILYGFIVLAIANSNACADTVEHALAYLDVVEALREDWNFDPFVMTGKVGYYYGRGTNDNKAAVAITAGHRWSGHDVDPDHVAGLCGDC